MIPFKPPEYNASAFNCPHCGAYAKQEWFETYSLGKQVSDVRFALCAHCQQYSLWRHGSMIYPSGGTAPLPNPDIPDEIKLDYEEARSIVSRSPRGAAALLRLAIQKVCKHLGEEGENINTDIANLVKKGLPEKVQKALDVVRVVGNNAVHPGQIDLRDDAATAGELFALVNLIAEVMITQPKHVDELYARLPESQKDAIKKRDAGA